MALSTAVYCAHLRISGFGFGLGLELMVTATR